ncbi:MAG: copper-binding protein, partial [Mastigocladus sp. ERB_26_1]
MTKIFLKILQFICIVLVLLSFTILTATPTEAASL